MTTPYAALDAWIDAHFDEQVRFLQELIRVPTDTPPGNNAPHAERTATLLEMARPRPEARFVSMTSYDGYTTNLTLEAFAAADVMVAHSWEGAPLTRQHGSPARLVLPRLYFWKSPKWLTRIELLAEDRPGFWEVRGYHNQGDPWLEERYG